jgi:hypothetical protein
MEPLPNAGNLCYANAVVQCLRGVTCVVQACATKTIDGSPLEQAFASVVTGKSRDCRRLCAIMCATHAATLADGAPNDAGEFYMLLAADLANAFPQLTDAWLVCSKHPERKQPLSRMMMAAGCRVRHDGRALVVAFAQPCALDALDALHFAKQNASYALRGAVIHRAGHYFAVVHAPDGCYLCDDMNVASISRRRFTQTASDRPSLLFFELTRSRC